MGFFKLNWKCIGGAGDSNYSNNSQMVGHSCVNQIDSYPHADKHDLHDVPNSQTEDEVWVSICENLIAG